MAYGNITPPPMLELDAALCPNIVLHFSYDKGATNWFQIHLYYAQSAFVFDGQKVTSSGGMVVCQSRSYDAEAWTNAQQAQEVCLSPGLQGDIYQRIWTLRDIPNADGTVWLEADHITGEKCDVCKWIAGLVMGMAEKPQCGRGV